jgi:hypothetical protein
MGMRLLLGFSEDSRNEETYIPLNMADPVHLCLVKSLIAEADQKSATAGHRSDPPMQQPAGPAEGKFPVSETSRCSHTSFWTRVRGKRGYSYFFCSQCELGWRQPRQKKQT